MAELSIHKEVVTWVRAVAPSATLQAIVIKPLCYTDYLHPDAYLILAVSPLRPNDQAQKQFLKEIRTQIEYAVRRVIRNEWELRESQHQYQLVMNAVPCLVWMSNPENECGFFNNAWLAFRGSTYEQEINSGWKQGIHPDDLEGVESVAQANFLTSISCNHAQGYLYSPALSAEAFETWLYGANVKLS